MPGNLANRLVHAYNAFRARDETEEPYCSEQPQGMVYSSNPSRPVFRRGNEKTIITAIYNKIAMDIAAYDIQHVKLDKNGAYNETINDGLNQCLTVSANKDQTGRSMIHDLVISMFDEGSVAVVPVETSFDTKISDSFNIFSLRVGRIVEFFPDFVRVELYNDITGHKKQYVVPKNICAIIENPLYAVMNEPNSTLKRLVQKLAMLDAVDVQNSADKLNLIIQLPYTVRSESIQKRAKERVNSLQEQLSNNKYGIGYADGTEKIIQLNRPIGNNLLDQIKYLTELLYNQLGVSEEVFSGKASEQVLRNYYDRTIEPIVIAIVEEMSRKFLTKTARTQGHTIQGFRNMFKLVPANEMANTADILSRNAILTPNEIRGIIGFKPSTEPEADELRNKNMPIEDSHTQAKIGGEKQNEEKI